jgi:hypothetical protein
MYSDPTGVDLLIFSNLYELLKGNEFPILLCFTYARVAYPTNVTYFVTDIDTKVIRDFFMSGSTTSLVLVRSNPVSTKSQRTAFYLVKVNSRGTARYHENSMILIPPKINAWHLWNALDKIKYNLIDVQQGPSTDELSVIFKAQNIFQIVSRISAATNFSAKQWYMSDVIGYFDLNAVLKVFDEYVVAFEPDNMLRVYGFEMAVKAEIPLERGKEQGKDPILSLILGDRGKTYFMVRGREGKPFEEIQFYRNDEISDLSGIIRFPFGQFTAKTSNLSKDRELVIGPHRFRVKWDSHTLTPCVSIPGHPCSEYVGLVSGGGLIEVKSIHGTRNFFPQCCWRPTKRF